MKWKICGMREPSNIMEVGKLNPNYMGFIFYEKSARYVSPDKLVPVINKLDTDIKKVGVFVNENIDNVLKVSDKLNLDLVQLHGHETVEYVKKVSRNDICVVKAFHIDEAFDWPQLIDYQELVDSFLFDCKGEHYGGNGTAFDWALLSNYTLEKPYFLSGGLDLVAVDRALTCSFDHMQALDLNSRFEDSPGMKNVDLLRKLKMRIN